MTRITRRTALLAAVALGAAACATTKTNGVTTVTVNTASVAAWAQAFINAAATVSTLPGIAGTPEAIAIAAFGPLISADADGFAKATNGALSLTFDSTSTPASISSLLADGRKLLAASQAAFGTVAAGATGQAQLYINALATIVSIFSAALGMAPVMGVSQSAMTETEAMMVLGVK